MLWKERLTAEFGYPPVVALVLGRYPDMSGGHDDAGFDFSMDDKDYDDASGSYDVGVRAPRHALRAILTGLFGVTLRFSTPFGLDAIPDDVDMVMCGTGDIIDGLFMSEVLRLVLPTTLPLYAASVDMPIDRVQPYLEFFDHVLVRASTDHADVAQVVGEDNATYIPDALFGATANEASPAPPIYSFPLNPRTIGVVLDHAAFAPDDDECVRKIASAIADVAIELRCKVALFSFEHEHGYVNGASDEALNDRVRIALASFGQSAHVAPRPKNMLQTRALLRSMLSVVAMRYEAVVFTAQEAVPTFVLYTSDSVHKLADDLHFDSSHRFRLAVTNDGYIDGMALETASPSLSWSLSNALRTFRQAYDTRGLVGAFASVAQAVLNADVGKRRALDADSLDEPEGQGPVFSLSFEVVHENVVSVLSALTLRSKAFVRGWYQGTASGYEMWDYGGVDVADVTRVIMYVVTESFGSPYADDIQTALSSSDLLSEKAAKSRVQDVMDAILGSVSMSMFSGPSLLPKKRAVMNGAVEVMAPIDWLDQAGHDTGWSFATRGLRYLSPTVHNRDPTAARVRVDTHLDRTFGWARSTLRLFDVIPYQSDVGGPWAGFVHHGFDGDENRGSRSSRSLLNDALFRQSLDGCVALFTLSADLAHKIRTSSVISGRVRRPQVYALVHPAEEVTSTRAFSIEAFRANSERRVVQIGVWTRDPYAIFDSVKIRYSSHFMSSDDESLKVRKAVLLGRRSERTTRVDHYFPDFDFTELLRRLRSSADAYLVDQCAWPTEDDESMCRPNDTKLGVTDPCVVTSKYTDGMFASLARRHYATDIIPILNDDSYDDLLTKNAVFMYLDDVSAVYEVHECIMRNTPLIVNRRPSLEEVLGKDYPGFYLDGDMDGASRLLSDVRTFERATQYLEGLDKKRFGLNAFVRSYHDALRTATDSYYKQLSI